jgi:hypothetical protein
MTKQAIKLRAQDHQLSFTLMSELKNQVEFTFALQTSHHQIAARPK